jgi:uncharacterized protein DUF5752
VEDSQGRRANDRPAGVETPTRKAKKPFYFNTSEHLLRIGREKAANLSQLLEAFTPMPGGLRLSAYFQDSPVTSLIRQGFFNDFAHWALSDRNEPALAERLASVDVREFTSIEELRQSLVCVLEDLRTQ